VRYRLLETIREYGLERLTESGAETDLRRRHRDHFADVVAAAQRRLFAPDQWEALAALRAEHANLRAALEFCATQPGEAGAGLAMAAALWLYWHGTGALSEGRRRLDRLLALSPEPTVERARALYVDAWLAIVQNDLSRGGAALEGSRVIGEELGDRHVLGYVALFRGMVAMSRGDLAGAVASYDDALAAHREAGDPIGVAMALYRRGLVAICRGEAQASAWGEACRTHCDEHGDRWWKAYALWELGLQAWRDGDGRRATALQRESILLNHLFDDRLGVALNLEALAWIAASAGDAGNAARLLGAAQTIWHTADAPLQGFSFLQTDHDQAEAAAREALGAKAWR